MPTTLSPAKNYSLQQTGENVGTWGVILNSNFSLIDNNLGGTLNIDISGSSGGTLSLTTSQEQYVFHNLTGVLSGNVEYRFTANGGIYFITNSTTGSYTTTITVAGGGASVVVPQNSGMFIGVDASALKVKTIAALNPANNLSDVLSASTSLSNLGGAPLASPVFTGTPSLPTGTSAVTQSAGDNSTKIATTAFVNGTALTLANNTTATTQAPGDNSTKLATTAFVATQPTLNQPNIVGTTTNNNATAGSVGEYVSSTVLVGSAVSLTTGTTANITSISLTAGDWDVEGLACFNPGGSTPAVYWAAAISTTSATLPTAPAGGFVQLYTSVATSIGGSPNAAFQQINTGTARVSIASTTTVYLVTQSTFSVGPNSAFGLLRARRIR